MGSKSNICSSASAQGHVPVLGSVWTWHSVRTSTVHRTLFHDVCNDYRYWYRSYVFKYRYLPYAQSLSTGPVPEDILRLDFNIKANGFSCLPLREAMLKLWLRQWPRGCDGAANIARHKACAITSVRVHGNPCGDQFCNRDATAGNNAVPELGNNTNLQYYP
jgi:hypothetical protein